MTLFASLASRSRFHDIQFTTLVGGEEILLVACEDHKVRLYRMSDVKEAEEGPKIDLVCVGELVGHKNR